jgi:hypothetical protein
MNSMTIKSFRKWVRRIYSTQEEEFDCEAFARVIPQYVDVEVSGGQAEIHFPMAKHHMLQCSECCDLYHTLYDIALLESRETTRAEQAELERRDVAADHVVLGPS